MKNRFNEKLFTWFNAHELCGESTFTKLGFAPTRGEAPYEIEVIFKDKTTKKFFHQYDTETDPVVVVESKKKKMKRVVSCVYWSPQNTGEKVSLYISCI